MMLWQAWTIAIGIICAWIIGVFVYAIYFAPLPKEDVNPIVVIIDINESKIKNNTDQPLPFTHNFSEDTVLKGVIQ